jgi:hypothetical protein
MIGGSMGVAAEDATALDQCIYPLVLELCAAK